MKNLVLVFLCIVGLVLLMAFLCQTASVLPGEGPLFEILSTRASGGILP